MSTALTKADPRDIALGGLVLTAMGAEVTGPVSEDHIIGAFALLDHFQRGVNWICGDLQIIGLQFGEEWVQQQLDTHFSGMSPSSKVQCQWVASKYPDKCTRVRSLAWGHHREAAGIENIEDRQRLLGECLPEPGQEDKGPEPLSEFRRRVRQYKLQKRREANPLPEGTYRVILADPPWRCCEDETVHETLSVAELYNLHATGDRFVEDLAQPDAVLFLWAQPSILPDALLVMKAWSFTYQTFFVWSKPLPLPGCYSAIQHELLLLGTRGVCVPDIDIDQLFGSALIAQARKPDALGKIIETMYTTGPYLELFGQKAREGWMVWGRAEDW